MTPETAKALEESIAHWKRMRDGTQKTGENPHSTWCALCQQFPCCEGCPVKEKTGLSQCCTTPYYDARDNWYAYGSTSSKFKAAAQVEIDFLESLREAPPIPPVAD